MKVPDVFLQHERWLALVGHFGIRPRVSEIVEGMEMDELLGREAKHVLEVDYKN